jgi:hypothetical protein
MDRLKIARSLQELQSEGESLASDRYYNQPGKGRAESVAAWHAAVFDVLVSSLPGSSRLVANLENAWNRYIGKAQEAGGEHIILSGTDPGHLGDKGDIGKLVESCLPIIHQARRVVLSRPLTADEQNDLRREIRGVITETYLSFKAWWFYIPSAILLASILFALTGAFQIRDLHVDIRDQADKAVKKAKDDIADQTKNLSDKTTSLNNETNKLSARVDDLNKNAQATIDAANKKIDKIVSDQKQRIESRTNEEVNKILPGVKPQIDELVSQHKQLIEVETKKKLKEIDAQALPDVKSQIEDLQTRADQIESSVEKSRTFVWVGLVAMSVFCALSLPGLASLTVGWWRRKRSKAH